ncbi:MAG: membrane integrity-associated transporter subunit PqiC [Burkholderiales bacterium]|nr:membrane integrity-associated transporter subunit PqiC [Burkholderiales bacterium]MDR4518183.1 ABC-type transport auxiliary lipoprotein family protein [Nitrosomonas sp.]
MKILFVVFVTVIVLLSGCTIFPKPNTTVATFNFIADTSAKNNQLDQPAAKSGKKILITHTTAPLWLDTQAIYYRLAYHNPFQSYAYSNSRWSSPPAFLLTQQIKQKIAADTNHLIIKDSSMAIVENELHIELEDFSHIFDTLTDSRVVIRFQASLVNNSHRLIAQKVFSAQQMAQSPDATGAVNAFSIASNQLMDELIQWLNIELSKL